MGAVAGETEEGEGEQSTLHLFQGNTYALQANNHSEIFSLPTVIISLNEGCIYNGSVCSGVDVFQ